MQPIIWIEIQTVIDQNSEGKNTFYNDIFVYGKSFACYDQDLDMKKEEEKIGKSSFEISFKLLSYYIPAGPILSLTIKKKR